MHDLLSEGLISLSAAAKYFPGVRANAHMNPSTLFRWCMRGARRPDGTRVTLEHVRAGSRIFTTRAALARFLAALSTDTSNNLDSHASPAKARRASERASDALAAEGW